MGFWNRPDTAQEILDKQNTIGNTPAGQMELIITVVVVLVLIIITLVIIVKFAKRHKSGLKLAETKRHKDYRPNSKDDDSDV
jgi:hypothetical protein